ncbi:hypothetical protein CNMCM5793_003931 [Aspergillus hiratsukae]|uniref:Uncharacterized protein n=1 Tax=Aspergillus hiratsukae TaxID=1194566 RepID=A0A8H6PEH7_9EURO|nr:hypothetical protein CNMCM5793_003931 [Aspergillus hiratsukae]KAF7169228.1 hypothetical protein CNMCM6106_004177 [Aspergillus hiratsukae]
MTPYRSSYVDYHELILPVRTATGQVLWTKGYGTIIVDLTLPDSTERIGSLIFPGVWRAPALAHNLISIRKLAELGIETVFKKDGGVELLYNVSPGVTEAIEATSQEAMQRIQGLMPDQKELAMQTAESMLGNAYGIPVMLECYVVSFDVDEGWYIKSLERFFTSFSTKMTTNNETTAEATAPTADALAPATNRVIRQSVLNYGTPMDMTGAMNVTLHDFDAVGRHPLQLVARSVMTPEVHTEKEELALDLPVVFMAANESQRDLELPRTGTVAKLQKHLRSFTSPDTWLQI